MSGPPVHDPAGPWPAAALPPKRFVLWMALLLGAGALFAAIAAQVLAGGPLTRLDVRIAGELHRQATPTSTAVLLVVTQLNSTFAIALYAVLLGALAWARRQWRWLTTLAAGIGGGLLLNAGVKLAFQRARPSFDDPVLTLATYSFPSGHVAASTIFYGLGVAWLFGRTRSTGTRTLAVVGAALVVGLVAYSRMALGVHFLSDTGAGFAEGIAWLAVCLGVIDMRWSKSGPTP